VPDAQKLAVAADLGKLSLALRRTGAAELAQTASMRTASFLGDPAPTTPGPVARGPARSRRVASPFAGPAAPALIQIVEPARREGASKPARHAQADAVGADPAAAAGAAKALADTDPKTPGAPAPARPA
jgi:pilus assembly protein CpaB